MTTRYGHGPEFPAGQQSYRDQPFRIPGYTGGTVRVVLHLIPSGDIPADAMNGMPAFRIESHPLAVTPLHVEVPSLDDPGMPSVEWLRDHHQVIDLDAGAMRNVSILHHHGRSGAIIGGPAQPDGHVPHARSVDIDRTARVAHLPFEVPEIVGDGDVGTLRIFRDGHDDADTLPVGLILTAIEFEADDPVAEPMMREAEPEEDPRARVLALAEQPEPEADQSFGGPEAPVQLVQREPQESRYVRLPLD